MVHNLPFQYRKDPWILALTAALQVKLDSQGENIRSLADQMSLDTVTWNIAVEEQLAGITPPAGATLEQRRAALRAKWRSSRKATLAQIKAVAESWTSHEVRASFLEGVIGLDIINLEEGEVEDIRQAVDVIKPAHLPLRLTEWKMDWPTVYVGCAIQSARRFTLLQEPYKQPMWAVPVYAGTVTRQSKWILLEQE